MKIDVDVLIFGGGIAGLWTLDEVHRRGYSAVLLESDALGSGQTIASQGILHGGLKYSLSGLVDPSSKAIAEMPARWNMSLAGEAAPDLRDVRVLSPCCYLWRTQSFSSRLGLVAAQAVIRTSIEKVSPGDRPKSLRDCPGDVLRVEERVLDMQSLLESFRRTHADRMALYDRNSLVLERNKDAIMGRATLMPQQSSEFRANAVIFCAGEGNADLGRKAGLQGARMQTRPLHMVMVHGSLPALFGHCVDGNKTRATITTATDSSGRNVWVVGGEVAEKGVERDELNQIAFAREELRRVLSGVDFTDTQWATYRIHRAEGSTPGNRRPEGVVSRREFHHHRLAHQAGTGSAIGPRDRRFLAETNAQGAGGVPAVMGASIGGSASVGTVSSMEAVKRAMSPIGYGAFKIGRNTGAKYEQAYALPDDAVVEKLLNGVLDLGVTYIDTAPAYGISEERIGRFLARRRGDFVLSTKVGERYEDGTSVYDFTPQAVRKSVEQSLRLLRTDAIDILFVHSPRGDLKIAGDGVLVGALRNLRERGLTKCLGFSGYSAEAIRAAMDWADALMLEYNANDLSLAPLIDEAAAQGKTVVVKKGLAGGRIPAEPAIRFVLGNPGVTSLLVSSLSAQRMADNIHAARSVRNWQKPDCRAESNG